MAKGDRKDTPQWITKNAPRDSIFGPSWQSGSSLWGAPNPPKTRPKFSWAGVTPFAGYMGNNPYYTTPPVTPLRPKWPYFGVHNPNTSLMPANENPEAPPNPFSGRLYPWMPGWSADYEEWLTGYLQARREGGEGDVPLGGLWIVDTPNGTKQAKSLAEAQAIAGNLGASKQEDISIRYVGDKWWGRGASYGNTGSSKFGNQARNASPTHSGKGKFFGSTNTKRRRPPTQNTTPKDNSGTDDTLEGPSSLTRYLTQWST